MNEAPSTVDLDLDILEQIEKGSRVLEFACARGRTAFKLEELGYSVTAFDIDPEAITFCRNEAKKRGSKVEFLEADGRNLPFEDSVFDACIMNAYMTMLDTRDSRIMGFLEGFRVLKEGGYLYLAEFLQTWDDPIYRERYEKHEHITGEKGTFIATIDGSIEGEEIYRAHHYTEGEIMSLINSRYHSLIEKRTRFTTYHGNEIDGIIMLVGKK
ncbi:MAG: class I SAM-dependent methyltransferase [Candidatus Thermoplasmatota archaeon]|nr:class I SAM-dependent methyltransferase [Candidatus Thermoplasmatota archaeon]